jgi:hypothetical protein
LSPRCFFPQSKTTSRSSQMLMSFMVIKSPQFKVHFFLPWLAVNFCFARHCNLSGEPSYSVVQCKWKLSRMAVRSLARGEAFISFCASSPSWTGGCSHLGRDDWVLYSICTEPSPTQLTN